VNSDNTNNHADRNGPGQPSAAALAGLAREVEALRRKLRPVEGLTGQVTELANMVADLADDMANHGRRNGEVLVPSWLALPWPGMVGAEDGHAAGEVYQDQVAALLDELVEWVGRVYLVYPDAAGSFPECWLWHPAAIEELLWLWHAWRAAYTEEGASVRLAGDWHDRSRPGVVRRIKASLGTCSLANHTHDQHTEPLVVGVPFAESAAQVARWWAGGQSGVGPEPTAGQLETSAGQWRTRRGGRR
jgi:hypothetical protein